jgi:hypothetical protein
MLIKSRRMRRMRYSVHARNDTCIYEYNYTDILTVKDNFSKTIADGMKAVKINVQETGQGPVEALIKTVNEA